jgi:hypothetical protein
VVGGCEAVVGGSEYPARIPANSKLTISTFVLVMQVKWVGGVWSSSLSGMQHKY